MKDQSPGHVGLFLIAIGTMSVILGSVEYFQTLKHLNKLSETHYKAFNYSLIIGIAVGLLGLFLFITILTNTELF